jgi:hypothetical protein
VPGSLGGRTFWSESDPYRKTDKRRAFLTDVSLIGGLIHRRNDRLLGSTRANRPRVPE